MNASKMIARMTTTIQKKNTMMPGIAYPATVLALATAASYPRSPDLFGNTWKASNERDRHDGREPAPRPRPGLLLLRRRAIPPRISGLRQAELLRQPGSGDAPGG